MSPLNLLLCRSYFHKYIFKCYFRESHSIVWQFERIQHDLILYFPKIHRETSCSLKSVTLKYSNFNYTVSLNFARSTHYGEILYSCASVISGKVTRSKSWNSTTFWKNKLIEIMYVNEDCQQMLLHIFQCILINVMKYGFAECLGFCVVLCLSLFVLLSILFFHLYSEKWYMNDNC